MPSSPTPPFRRLSVPIRNRWGDGEMALLDFGDPERAPDLVFVHANGFNAGTYRRLLAPLGGRFRVLAPDLRGHGRTRLPTRTEGRRHWHDHRDDLIGLLEALGGPPPVLAGHSMGGTTGLMAAAERPDLVRRLVLLDPVIWARPMALMFRLPLLDRVAGANPLIRNTLRRRARFASRDEALKAYRGRGAFKGWSDAVLADYLADGLVETDDGLALACAPSWEASNYAAQAQDVWGALKRASQAIHVLKAGQGSICHLETDRRRPNLSVETVEGGGHMFPLTHTAETREALEAVLG